MRSIATRFSHSSARPHGPAPSIANSFVTRLLCAHTSSTAVGAPRTPTQNWLKHCNLSRPFFAQDHMQIFNFVPSCLDVFQISPVSPSCMVRLAGWLKHCNLSLSLSQQSLQHMCDLYQLHFKCSYSHRKDVGITTRQTR